MIVYYTRKIPETTGVQITSTAMALFEGLSFMLGAVCSAFSGYAGMWVSVRANIELQALVKDVTMNLLKLHFMEDFLPLL